MTTLWRALALSTVLFAVACGPSRTVRTPAPATGAIPASPAPAPRDPSWTPDYRPRDRTPPSLSAVMRDRCRALRPLFEEVGGEYGVEPALLMAIARVESGFRTSARSRAGAEGLMQIMPRTGKGLSCGRLHHAESNVRCGALVLVRNLERFGGSKVYALAAYNGGGGYVRAEYQARRLPRNFRYVERVLKYLAHFRRHGC